MITLSATSLRSRVARRVFGVFLVCAFIPFAALVIFSYYKVNAFFNDRTQHQLRAMAKTLAVDTFQRLLLSKSSLTIIASTVAISGRFPTEKTLDWLPDHPKERWKALAIMTADERLHRVFGDIGDFPRLTALEKKQALSGKALILVRPSPPPSPARVFMSLIDDPQQSDHRTWIGELEEAYLWNLAQIRALPSYIKPCVINRSGTTIMCTYSPTTEFVAALAAHVSRNDVGDFAWRQEGTHYQAGFWTIPIKAEFASGGWTIVLHTSKEGIFASIAELKNVFFLSIIVSIGLSVLLATYQFRKRLVPVEQLQEGTRRIGNKDFDITLKITTGDEFEELAVALNAMAGQLSQQFNTLETTSEIDRAVLSLLDTPKIVETILTRIMNFLHCNCATLRLLDSEGGGAGRLFVIENSPLFCGAAAGNNHDGHHDSSTLQILAFQPLAARHSDAGGSTVVGDPIARLVAEKKNLFVASDLNFYPDISGWDFVRRRGMTSCVGVPLFVSGELLGVMGFYARNRHPFRADEISLIKSVTSQAAIAIYNSQLYERTKQQAHELEEANKIKDEFLGIVSHELRTPLNLILGYSNMIREKILGDINADQEKALETVLVQSNELLLTIESIMDATKLESGAVVTEKGLVDLSAVFEDLESKFTVPPDKEVTIRWHYSSSLPRLMTDEEKLRRILQNLIHNAIKFTDKGEITIAARHNSAAQSVEVKVIDTGIGIPEEVLPQLFGLFRQQDSSATREHGGLGLGLFIAKKLLDLIGAQITVESKVGSGSTFTVIIPTGVEDDVSATANVLF